MAIREALAGAAMGRSASPFAAQPTWTTGAARRARSHRAPDRELAWRLLGPRIGRRLSAPGQASS